MNSGPNIYAEVAHIKYPGFAVSGSGPFAVFYRCNGQRQIQLCEFVLEARLLLANNCGANCSHDHSGINLKENSQPRHAFKKTSLHKMLERA